MDTSTVPPPPTKEYQFAKYNVSVTVPTFTDEEYSTHLESNDWSREETDYMLSLVRDYSQKWPIIVDRYEWTAPQLNSSQKFSSQAGYIKAVVKSSEPQGRALEQIKARYYEIWAKTLALKAGGMANMNETEFQLHEALTKYNPTTEAARKELAWALHKRSVEEIREEEYLLSELQRIAISAHKFETERAEVRARLESAPTLGNTLGMPNSFAAYNQLYNQLMAQDRNRKSRHRLSIGQGDMMMQSPVGMTPLSAHGHRDSLSGLNNSQQKKGSMSMPTPVRAISSSAESRFGVSTHERLTSGVNFRSDRLMKLRQAKSQIQTQKIALALGELGVPDLIQLPTMRVLGAFEKLVGRVQRLVDARKLVEKEEGECRVQGALREELKKQDDGTGEGEGDTTMIDEETQDAEEDNEDDKDAEGEEEDDAEGEDDADGDGDDADADAELDAEVEEDEDADGDGDEDAEGEEEDEDDAPGEPDDDIEPTRPSSSRSLAASIAREAHKRTASVLSTASVNSKASKRSRRGR
jgi:DNA methyltransferase 1-associated protein 1